MADTCRTCQSALPAVCWGAPWCRGCVGWVPPIERQQCHWPLMLADPEFVARIDSLIRDRQIKPAGGHVPKDFETGPGAIRIRFPNNDNNTTKEQA